MAAHVPTAAGRTPLSTGSLGAGLAPFSVCVSVTLFGLGRAAEPVAEAGMRSPWSSVGALEPQWLRVDWSPFPHTKVLADFGGRRGRPGVAPEAFIRGLISGQRNKHILLYWLWA